MAHIVKAPLVVARKDDGTYVHVYEGGVLPENTDADQLAQLVESDMVVEGEGSADGAKPKANAGVAKWREYAVAQGLDEDEVSAMSKDDIRALLDDE